MIDIDHPNLSVFRQVELLGINRSSLYYVPVVNEERIELGLVKNFV
jgi:hypothetical protein